MVPGRKITHPLYFLFLKGGTDTPVPTHHCPKLANVSACAGDRAQQGTAMLALSGLRVSLLSVGSASPSRAQIEERGFATY